MPIGPHWLSRFLGERARFVLERPVSLSLPINDQDPQEVSRVLGAVAGLETLTDVSLNVRVTDDSLLKLRPLKGMTRLQLPFSKVTVGGLSVLDSLPELRILNLGYSGTVDDRALVAISRATEMEELFLRGTSITDAGLAQLTTLRKLRVLDLAYNPIHDNGLVALAGLTSLEFLDVSATSVTDEGLAALRRALPNLEITDD